MTFVIFFAQNDVKIQRNSKKIYYFAYFFYLILV